MKKITTSSGVFGPYTHIIEESDAYLVDGAKLPFNVVGSDGVISDWSSADYYPPVFAAQIPEQVSMRQARLALLNANLLDDVELIINAAGRAAQVEWEYAATVDRNHPVLSVVQNQQGMTDSEIDDLFVSAAAL